MLRWLKWGFLFLSIGSLSLAFVLIGMHGSDTPQEQAATDSGQTRIEKPLMVERKGERTVWRLRSDKAEQQLDGAMYLLGPSLELYTETDEQVPVTGEEAWFDALKRRVRFVGRVRVRYRDMQLESEELVYDGGKDVLHVPGKFRLKGERIKMHGEGLRAKRSTEQLWVEKGVWMEVDIPDHDKEGS